MAGFQTLNNEYRALLEERRQFLSRFERSRTLPSGYVIRVGLRFVTQEESEIKPYIKLYDPNGNIIPMPELPPEIFNAWAIALNKWEDWVDGLIDDVPL